MDKSTVYSKLTLGCDLKCVWAMKLGDKESQFLKCLNMQLI